MSVKRPRPSRLTLTGGHPLSPAMVELWREGTYCDMHLRSPTLPPHLSPAHRLVIAAASPRAARLVAEAPYGCCVELPPVRGDALDAVLEFLYCGACEVDEEDSQLLEEIGAAAAYLELLPLRHAVALATREGAGDAAAAAPAGSALHLDGGEAAEAGSAVVTPLPCPSAEELSHMTYHQFAAELSRVEAHLKRNFFKQKDRALKAYGVSEATLSEALKPKGRQAVKKLGPRVASEWANRIDRARRAQPELGVADASSKLRRESFRSSAYRIENMALDEWLQRRLEAMQQQGGKFTAVVENEILNYVNTNLARWNTDNAGQELTARMDKKALRNWMNKHGFPRGAFSDEMAQPQLLSMADSHVTTSLALEDHEDHHDHTCEMMHSTEDAEDELNVAALPESLPGATC
ncbi:hypothetical protein AB1Y20_011414 [Prymnesium parvum]|uniref:BTB domain-containing protein n=1 Tax=Prymnesium parvum TaxID=97485 RepID=A0AB34IMT7_PRYPA